MNTPLISYTPDVSRPYWPMHTNKVKRSPLVQRPCSQHPSPWLWNSSAPNPRCSPLFLSAQSLPWPPLLPAREGSLLGPSQPRALGTPTVRALWPCHAGVWLTWREDVCLQHCVEICCLATVCTPRAPLGKLLLPLWIIPWVWLGNRHHSQHPFSCLLWVLTPNLLLRCCTPKCIQGT